MGERVRSWLAWALFGVGHLMWLVFDRWLPWGMPWPIYQAYNRIMGWSDIVQGAGPHGPWSAETDAP